MEIPGLWLCVIRRGKIFVFPITSIVMPSLALYWTTFTFYLVATGIQSHNILTQVCTITSIFLPNWLTYNSTSKLHIHLTYGLTKHCSSFYPHLLHLISRITGTCHPFPTKQDCSTSPSLCDTWKSASFLLLLAVILQGMTLAAYIAVFNGGYTRILNGWKVLALLHVLIGYATRGCI